MRKQKMKILKESDNIAKLSLIISVIALIVSIGSFIIDQKTFEYNLKPSYNAKINFNSNSITFTNIADNYDIVKADIVEKNYMNGYTIDPQNYENHKFFGNSLYVIYNARLETQNKNLSFSWDNSKVSELLGSVYEYVFTNVSDIGNFWISTEYYIMIEYQNSFGDYNKDYFNIDFGFSRRESIGTSESKNFIIDLNDKHRLSLDEYNYATQNQYIYDNINNIDTDILIKKLGL